jgi:hypothetical protein
MKSLHFTSKNRFALKLRARIAKRPTRHRPSKKTKEDAPKTINDPKVMIFSQGILHPPAGHVQHSLWQ